MAEGVPRIWTLKEEARGLPPCTAEDLDSIAKLRNSLPHGENKRPWYTFCDEAMLVAAGLVYEKVFSSKDKSQPPSWEDISSITASTQPQLVTFDDMLMDRLSLFTRVAIVTKTKPCESLYSKAVSSSLPPTTTVPIPAINPFMKRMETAAPSVPPPKRAKKTIPSRKKVLAWDSSSEESPNQEMQLIVGAKAQPASIVALDSSTTISD
ncbi:hypothetical protein LIER_23280 [Lithospermum erythrorhizon]|uniref:Uncharacterized protein n=1 Tax=Lithospermum erythrorhizon TaxID=34254 RepID=A0AAV3R133_LITER